MALRGGLLGFVLELLAVTIQLTEEHDPIAASGGMAPSSISNRSLDASMISVPPDPAVPPEPADPADPADPPDPPEPAEASGPASVL
jgi:hypothetical protein